MVEPKRNYESSIEDKKKYVEYLLLKASQTGDSEYAWKIVDFLIDTMLIDKVK